MRKKVCSELSTTRPDSPVTFERFVGLHSHYCSILRKEAIAEYTRERRESEDETLSRGLAKRVGGRGFS